MTRRLLMFVVRAAGLGFLPASTQCLLEIREAVLSLATAARWMTNNLDGVPSHDCCCDISVSIPLHICLSCSDWMSTG